LATGGVGLGGPGALRTETTDVAVRLAVSFCPPLPENKRRLPTQGAIAAPSLCIVQMELSFREFVHIPPSFSRTTNSMSSYRAFNALYAYNRIVCMEVFDARLREFDACAPRNAQRLEPGLSALDQPVRDRT
jgi:hypothetical protein